MHSYGAVTGTIKELRVMADYQHPHPPFFHRLQENPPDLGLTDRIQHGRDLIGNDKGGLRGQGTGNGQSLELAAGTNKEK